MKASLSHIGATLLSLITSCGHISDVNVTAGATEPAKAADGSETGETFTLGVALHFRNESALDALIVRLYDPKSPDYGKFLTPDEFQAQFGPRPEAVARVRHHLGGHGMNVAESPQGQFIKAHATKAQAEAAFKTTVVAHTAHDGRQERGIKSAPKLPAGIAAVHNLKTPPRRHPQMRRVSANPEPMNVKPLSASDIRTVYNVPANVNSKDRYLALVELDGYDPADIKAYAKANKMTLPPITNILVSGFDGNVIDPDAQVEVTMDIEVMAAMAGQTKEILVYETSQQQGTLLGLFNEIANPTLGDKKMPHIISCSWGAPEGQMTASDAKAEAMVFKQMAAQGQTVFAASGDAGANDDGTTLGTDDPASQPYVVAVGGTTLNSHAGSYISESAWYDGQGGGGGGISRFWSMPAWQRGIAGTASKASLSRRNVPDVALNADPQTGYNVYVSGQWMTVGGTSCAAPIWAAFMGIVNTQRLSKKLPDIGFLSPTLYRIGSGAGGAAAFHDIADNSTNGYYPAVPGFDDATGWGSMDGARFLQLFTAK